MTFTLSGSNKKAVVFHTSCTSYKKTKNFSWEVCIYELGKRCYYVRCIQITLNIVTFLQKKYHFYKIMNKEYASGVYLFILLNLWRCFKLNCYIFLYNTIIFCICNLPSFIVDEKKIIISSISTNIPSEYTLHSLYPPCFLTDTPPIQLVFTFNS